MNEYYNYAENNNAGNAEQCGNVPPVNVYGRADGQFVQPQRQLQGPPEAKKIYGIRDFIFAVMTVIIGFITLKLFFTEGEIFPFAEVIASGWYHVIVATLAVMAVIYIGKKPTASQWAIFGCVILFCAVPVFSSTGLVRFLSWVYAAILLCYFAYSFITSKPLFSDGFLRKYARLYSQCRLQTFPLHQSAWLFLLQIRKKEKKAKQRYIFCSECFAQFLP